jgi:hypothetical protein
MPAQLKISITKEILEQSKYCSTNDKYANVAGENCAIANALKYIFPEVYVTGNYIYPFAFNNEYIYKHLCIKMPKIAKDFIRVFDSLCQMPNARLLLPEFEFEISIPDEIIEQIDIEDVKKTVQEGLTFDSADHYDGDSTKDQSSITNSLAFCSSFS